jgi:hypothetical protein
MEADAKAKQDAIKAQQAADAKRKEELERKKQEGTAQVDEAIDEDYSDFEESGKDAQG